MKIGALLMLNGIVATAFGVGFLLAPAQTVAPYGVELTAPGLLVGRLFGATLIGYGILTWRLRKAAEGEALRSVEIALGVANALGLVVSAYGAISGVVNALGWSTVALYAIFAAGYLWFVLRSPSPAAA